ncbi:MAG: hypothetical protein HWE27_15385 [Gammaproteobacteria bacterium]|nr:hypothetical protein [Gammaproteobacteria bacterium]
MTTNPTILYLPALEDVLKFDSPNGSRWREFLSSLSTVSRPEKYQSELLSFSGSQKNKLRESKNYLWCPLLQCQPDQGGVRVARVVESDDVQQYALNILQQHFSSANVTFIEQDKRLMMQSEEPLPHDWPSITSILNRNLFEFIVNAKGVVHWHSLLNEVQMLIAQDVKLSELGVNSIWIEPVHSWLNVDSKQEHESIIIDARGVNLFLTGSNLKLEDWLNDSLQDSYQFLTANSDNVITDGQQYWKCSFLQRIKLKLFFKI